MKGAIKPDHISTNKYELLILGMPSLTTVEITGLEDELQTTELPDRTRASGGNTGPTEFDVIIPMHHTVERAAMEIWFREGQDPVLPTYKKGGTLIYKSISGNSFSSRTLIGVFVTKRADPDLEMEGEGEMASITYTLSVDKILPF